MKKILTLVLALALVFALAAPALAITGDTSPDETNPSSAPVSLDVELFTAPEAFGGGTLSISRVASNKMYIVNEVAYWGVALEFYDKTEYDFNMQPRDYKDSVLTISCDAFALKTVGSGHTYSKTGSDKVKRNQGVPGLSLNDKDKLTTSFPSGKDGLWGTGTTVYYFGQGVVTGKGLLKAEIAKTPSWGGDGLEIYKSNGSILYTVKDETDGFRVTKPEVGNVFFEVDSDDEVTGIFVFLEDGELTQAQEVEFKKKTSGGGSIVLAIGDYEDDDLEDAIDLYNGVMKFFGFNYDAEGRLLRKHFESKCRALYLKDQATINLYTGSIVIPDPEVAPPKTGDAASVMGFVMIALALAAAGVVVAKKKIRA
ncbi:MAG: hypothetical protein BWY11_00720 [Firmicutes bacterium ADurb.Bin182]|nr:MAG: hypothetical protein BWY11_00720 [Firmicutes bacterium ADurb.Bin182]